MMKSRIKYIISIMASWVLMWPHAILFYLSPHRRAIIEDVMADMAYRKTKISGVNAVLYVILLDKYYRKLFYSRIGNLSLLVSWLWRGENTFYPLCRNIGGGVFAIHPYATILNARSIGKNFSCRQCTTIGNKQDDRPEERPTIGDNVTLGANVVIIGNIHIGNNVIIGAGSVVVKDIPDNCVVVGNPAKIIRSLS